MRRDRSGSRAFNCWFNWLPCTHLCEFDVKFCSSLFFFSFRSFVDFCMSAQLHGCMHSGLGHGIRTQLLCVPDTAMYQTSITILTGSCRKRSRGELLIWRDLNTATRAQLRMRETNVTGSMSSLKFKINLLNIVFVRSDSRIVYTVISLIV